MWAMKSIYFYFDGWRQMRNCQELFLSKENGWSDNLILQQYTVCTSQTKSIWRRRDSLKRWHRKTNATLTRKGVNNTLHKENKNMPNKDTDWYIQRGNGKFCIIYLHNANPEQTVQAFAGPLNALSLNHHHQKIVFVKQIINVIRQSFDKKKNID